MDPVTILVYVAVAALAYAIVSRIGGGRAAAVVGVVNPGEPLENLTDAVPEASRLKRYSGRDRLGNRHRAEWL